MTTAAPTDSEFKILDILAAAGGDDPSEGTGSGVEAQALYDRRREREDAQVISFNKVFKYRPWDGAVAFQRVLLRLFGTSGIGAVTMTMFGPQEPEMREIPSGVDETIQVPWGKVDFPIFGEDAKFVNKGVWDPELGSLYELRFSAPKRFSRHIRGLFKEVDQELAVNSIYRGKAFDGQEMPQFLDLSTVDSSKIVYSKEVTDALTADVWALIEHTDLLRSLDVPLKHAVLLEGEYGTGKTLAGLVTALKAHDAKEDWAFIQCRPGRDDYEAVMGTARLYQPCVVFLEDVDCIADPDDDDDDSLSRLLDVYDGAAAKGAEILVVLTTNHPDRIHKGMIRPGRIDRVISIGKQDSSSITRMIETSVEPALREDLTGYDYEQIAKAMEGFTPAFVKEAIHRTMRHAIVRAGGRPTSFVADDFIAAAHSLAPHLTLMREAREGKAKDTLGKAFEDLVVDVIERTRGDFDGAYISHTVK